MERVTQGRQPRVHRSYRLPAETAARLSEQAHVRRIAETSLVERYVEEGLRQERHPGIIFVDGPAGRRPRVAGTGPDVWEVVQTFLDQDRSLDDTAAYLALPARSVRAAVEYYADFTTEIDDWITENERAFDDGLAAARRVEAVTG